MFAMISFSRRAPRKTSQSNPAPALRKRPSTRIWDFSRLLSMSSKIFLCHVHYGVHQISERASLSGVPACHVECVGRLPSLPTMVSDSSPPRSVAVWLPSKSTLDMSNSWRCLSSNLPHMDFHSARLAPFVVMVIHATMDLYLAAKQGFNRKKRPLATGLQLV